MQVLKRRLPPSVVPIRVRDPAEENSAAPDPCRRPRIPKTAKPKLICCQQFRHANLFQSLAGPRGKPVLPLLVLEPLASSGQPLRAEADNREIQQLSGTSLVGLHGTTGAFLRHPPMSHLYW